MTERDSTIPSWDGTARTWRRYTREVAWYFRATPCHKRRYVATKLLSKLTGSARLLAMSWTNLDLDKYDGTKVLLQRLAASPLVRQSLPNASAICSQYFSFRRHRNEPMTSFLVRESLGYSEFVEALVRLSEDKRGVRQEDQDFGLPPEPEESEYPDYSEYREDPSDRSWAWHEWEEWAWEQEQAASTRPGMREEDVGNREEDPTGGPSDSNSPFGRYQRRQEPERPATPSRRSAGIQPTLAGDGLSELSFADSFVLGVLRGFRLLQAAGLSAEDRRDILSSTRGSLDFEQVNRALQTLWDEQFTGHRGSQHIPMQANLQESFVMEEDQGWDDWNQQSWDVHYVSEDWNSDWQDWDWSEAHAAEKDHDDQALTPEEEASLKEAQQAEKMAESLAIEAQRSWTEAQRATAALRRDRGFGQHAQQQRGPCWICNGPHFHRDCPDRNHPQRFKGKSKGKSSFAAEVAEPYYEDYYMKGKGKGKGKGGKGLMWNEAQAWMKGRPSNHRGKGKGPQPRAPVNAYSSEIFYGGLELQQDPHEAMHSMMPERTKVGSHGLLDSGATASAGPQLAVEKLIHSVLAKDAQAVIEVRKERPYFRFGNGRWGRALYRVEITSSVSGKPHTFKLFALPNPPELHRPDFDEATLVPILIGMDHLAGVRSAMAIDFHTGLALDSHAVQPHVYQLEVNKKGHYVLDILHFLTRGRISTTGHPRVHVLESSSTSTHDTFLQFMPLEFDTHLSNLSLQCTDDVSLEQSRRNLLLLHEHVQRQLHVPPQLSAHMQSSKKPLNSELPDHSSHVEGPSLQDDRRTGRQTMGHQECHSFEDGTTTLRRSKESRTRPSGPTFLQRAVALLQPPSRGCGEVEPPREMDSLQDMQCPIELHSSSGISRSDDQGGERAPGKANADRASASHAKCGAHGGDLLGHAEKDRCRDSTSQLDPSADSDLQGESEEGVSFNENKQSGTFMASCRTTSDGESRDSLGEGHCGIPPGGRDARAHEGDQRAKGLGKRDRPDLSGRGIRGRKAGQPMSSSKKAEQSSSLPRNMAAKTLLMMTTLLSTMTSMTTEFLLDGQDGVWEVACAPHSWLSEACNRQGLKSRRINLSEGFDLYKPKTWEHLRSLRRRHRPRRMWISLPCTKWSQWQYINYQTAERKELLAAYRRKELKMLWLAVNFVEEALLEDPDLELFWEWPWPCLGWKQAPLRHLATFLESHQREWLPCRIDGCNYGLREKDGTGDFLRKQWMVRITSTTFHKRFRCKTCPGGHRHSTVEGVETNKSSYYPWKMVQSIAVAWRQDLLADRNLRLIYSQEDVPSMIPIEEELEDEEERQLMGLPAVREEEELVIRDEVEPTAQELEKWRARLAHFHKAAGHPSARNLARLVRDSGSPQWKVREALQHQCETCKSLKPGGMSSGQIPPAATHSLCQAWEAVGFDTAEWLVPGLKKKARFLLMIDLATKLRVVVLLKIYPELAMQPESSDEIIEAFSTSWLAHYPKPQMVVVDNAKSFSSQKFQTYMDSQCIRVHYPPEKEPWSHGIVEAAVHDVKAIATAIHMEAMDNSPQMTLALTASALNSTEYTAGFSSHQWAFGAKYSISDEDLRILHSVDPRLDFINVAKARQDAEEVARRTRARRVLSKLANTTVKQPLRQYKPTELVMVWRRVQVGDQHQGARGGHKKSGRPHWTGPGRVVFAEAVPHQDEEDLRQHILWVLMGKRLWRCSVHSVRPVSESERLRYELTSDEDPSQWKTLADVLPRREFTDITSEEPQDGELELPDLPPAPDGSTYAPIRRANEKKTLKATDYKVVHRSSPIGQTTSTPTPKHFVPPSGATSSTDPLGLVRNDGGNVGLEDEDYTPSIAPAPVNDYNGNDSEPEEPDTKKARFDRAVGHDLKWLEMLTADAHDEIQHEDIFTALESYEEECIMFELELDFKSHKQRRDFVHDPVMYLVKKMNNSEVQLKSLSPADRVLFERAKGKEVGSFLKNVAVRKCLDDQEVREAFGTGRIVKARWVLTWKPIPPDERLEAERDVRENEQTVIRADASKKAKARIVLLGFQHPSLLDPTFKTSVPVISSLGKNLLYMASVIHQWPLEGLDLATAFLQTMPTEADERLWTFGVPELRDALGVSEGSCMRILKNIYGSTTAPRGLWLSLNKKLESLGGVSMQGERCLWAWFSKTEKDTTGECPKLLGLMGGHVDDFHRVGDRQSEEWCEICHAIDNAYQWGTVKTGSYRHAGTDVHTIKQKDGRFRIRVDQDSYVESLADVEIPPERLRSNGKLSPQEVGACRTALGALQWLAIQSQPLLTARCNLLLSEITTCGNMDHAREIQGMIGEIRNKASVLEFFPLPGVQSWRDVVFVSMGDQAHANRERGSSTGGMILLAAGPESKLGVVTKMMLLGWKTWKLKRKAIGSNDAEVQSILEAEDVNFRARLLWAGMHGGHEAFPSVHREDLVDVTERLARLVAGILCTDSRGGYDAVEVNESPLLGLSNLRAALQAYQLRDNLGRVGCELRWLASDYDLADAFTKRKAESRLGLQRFLETWEWSIAFDPTFTAAKKNKKLGRTAIQKMEEESSQRLEDADPEFLRVLFALHNAGSCLFQTQLKTEKGFSTGAVWEVQTCQSHEPAVYPWSFWCSGAPFSSIGLSDHTSHSAGGKDLCGLALLCVCAFGWAQSRFPVCCRYRKLRESRDFNRKVKRK